MINPLINVASSQLKQTYNSAEEYPHIVFDNFVNKTILDDVARESIHLAHIEDEKTRDWRMGPLNSHESQIYKRSIDDLGKMTLYMNLLCRYFNSDDFIKFLRELTGIKDLMPDPKYTGGGFHVTYPGGLLNIHHDFNYRDDIYSGRVYRKVNLLIYLNEHWEKDWKGELEFWKSDLTEKFKTILPKYGTAVIFNIENAPHGHPEPLECPDGESRRSLAFYYYSNTPNKNKLYDRAHWKYGKKLL
jgi:Rps23 Pro-64 3,4-dihydroxylase Tpa1-like proline 4-hydroxylase